MNETKRWEKSTGAGLLLALLASAARADDAAPTSATGAPAPVVLQAGAEWAAYDLKLGIRPGSVFDQSALADAPAGKYGRIRATEAGHFEFEGNPGVRARFYGVNTTFATNFLEKDKADWLADTLVRSGYNAVRIHHYDGLLAPKGTPSGQLDPQQLDRLDYFFAALKKRGLYVVIDLYTFRSVPPDELPDTGETPLKAIKRVMPLSDGAFQAWARFAAALVSHRNPYTGLAWGDDPALIGICPVNEDPIFNLWSDKLIRPLYDEAFARWQAQGNGKGENRDTAFNRFLVETQIAADRKKAVFLRSLGVKTPLTGANCLNVQALTAPREEYDYVDNHEYWNHPNFPVVPWALPASVNPRGNVEAEAWLPRTLFAPRIVGKPYAVTEFNDVWPNPRRGEGSAVMASYAALQDWDALFNFDFGDERVAFPSPVPSHFFDISSDPINLLADRAGALLFRAGGIRAAPHAVCYAVDAAAALANGKDSIQPVGFPPSFSRLGFVVRIGSRSGPATPLLQTPWAKAAGLSAVVSPNSLQPDPAAGPVFALDDALPRKLAATGILPPGSFDAERQHYVSETGQIEMACHEGTFRVVTDRAECFALNPGGSATGTAVAVDNGDTFGCVDVLAADGKPLKESRRLLVLHLTDSLNTGTTFQDKTLARLEKYGELPHLVRKGEAKIALTLPHRDGIWRAWAVDASGDRTREIPLEDTGSHLSFRTRTPDGATPQLAYEIAFSDRSEHP